MGCSGLRHGQPQLRQHGCRRRAERLALPAQHANGAGLHRLRQQAQAQAIERRALRRQGRQHRNALTDGTAATPTLPRSCLPSARISCITESNCCSRRCARGRNSRPARVKSRRRVERSNSKTPRSSSRWRIVRLSADCVTNSASAARVRLARDLFSKKCILVCPYLH